MKQQLIDALARAPRWPPWASHSIARGLCGRLWRQVWPWDQPQIIPRGVKLETNRPTTPPEAPRAWAPAVRNFVQERQERYYRNLASALGLGSDPASAYAHLQKYPLPKPVDIAARLAQDELGLTRCFTPAALNKHNQKVLELYTEYYLRSKDLPTPYEDPRWYMSVAITFDELTDVLAKKGIFCKPLPLLATLPSGQTNAIIEIEPDTDTPIVFFEHGLFRFFYDFSLVVGWSIPPLSMKQIADDVALTQLTQRYTIPFQAPGYFAGSLHGYAASGSPLGEPSPNPKPRHNLSTSLLLLTLMEQFVMAHELAHLTSGHLNANPQSKEEAWEQEYEADAAALAIVCEMAVQKIGSWATAVWACDLALTALHYLESSLALLEFGSPKWDWISQTHPPPYLRRTHLRTRVGKDMERRYQTAWSAASNLCGMTDGLILKGIIADTTAAMIVLSHQRGQRPSPLWRNHLDDHFAASS